MTLRTEQAVRRDPDRDGYWKWSVWIDGPGQELDEIQEVHYRLHPSYRNRNRSKRKRSNNFKIDGSGWGEFNIVVTITKKNGETLTMDHWLRLGERLDLPDATAQGLDVELKPKVFLSYAVSDTGIAESVQTLLEQKGISVESANTVPLGESLVSTIERGIGTADRLLVLESANANPSMEWEIELAEEHHIPILRVNVSGRTSSVPDNFDTLNRFTVDDISDTGIQDLTDYIVGSVKEVGDT